MKLHKTYRMMVIGKEEPIRKILRKITKFTLLSIVWFNSYTISTICAAFVLFFCPFFSMVWQQRLKRMCRFTVILIEIGQGCSFSCCFLTNDFSISVESSLLSDQNFTQGCNARIKSARKSQQK